MKNRPFRKYRFSRVSKTYRIVKNEISADIGLTKEDMMQMIQEVIAEEVTELFKTNNSVTDKIHRIIRRKVLHSIGRQSGCGFPFMNAGIASKITDMVGKQLFEKIILSVTIKE